MGPGWGDRNNQQWGQVGEKGEAGVWGNGAAPPWPPDPCPSPFFYNLLTASILSFQLLFGFCFCLCLAVSSLSLSLGFPSFSISVSLSQTLSPPLFLSPSVQLFFCLTVFLYVSLPLHLCGQVLSLSLDL